MEISKRLNIRTILPLFSELSFSSNLIRPFVPENVPDVHYYANREGQLTPIIAGTIPRAVYDHMFFLGVIINDQLHPIFDRHRRWILVELHTARTVIVTPELYHTYGYMYPARIISQFENHNNVALVMPRRRHNRPSGGQQRHK